MAFPFLHLPSPDSSWDLQLATLLLFSQNVIKLSSDLLWSSFLNSSVNETEIPKGGLSSLLQLVSRWALKICLHCARVIDLSNRARLWTWTQIFQLVRHPLYQLSHLPGFRKRFMTNNDSQAQKWWNWQFGCTKEKPESFLYVKK